MTFEEWIDSEIDRRSEVVYQYYLKQKRKREIEISTEDRISKRVRLSMDDDVTDKMMRYEKRYEDISEVNAKEYIAKNFYYYDLEGTGDWLALLFSAKEYDEILAEMQHLIDQLEQVQSKTTKTEIDIQCQLAEIEPIKKKLSSTRKKWLGSKKARDKLMEEFNKEVA